jgi:hypothetical protein
VHVGGLGKKPKASWIVEERRHCGRKGSGMNRRKIVHTYVMLDALLLEYVRERGLEHLHQLVCALRLSDEVDVIHDSWHIEADEVWTRGRHEGV